MSILITGGAGFVGSELAVRTDKNHRVVVMDNPARRGRKPMWIAWRAAWNPTVTLDQGFERILDWIRSNEGALRKRYTE